MKKINIVINNRGEELDRVIGRPKRVPHWGVQSRFHVIYICWSVCLSWAKMCRRNYVRACSKSVLGS